MGWVMAPLTYIVPTLIYEYSDPACQKSTMKMKWNTSTLAANTEPSLEGRRLRRAPPPGIWVFRNENRKKNRPFNTIKPLNSKF